MSKSGPSQPYKAYHQATHTVGKTRQVVMLYDGVIRFLQQAAEAMEQGQIETRYHKLTKATDVLGALQACLDFEVGGTAAQILHDFYSTIESKIHGLHRGADRAICLEIIEELKQMRDAWDKIDREGATPTAEAKSAAGPSDTVTVSA
ncbi:MAG: flagellar export chaperone FliS [Rickettsiales bacterium]